MSLWTGSGPLPRHLYGWVEPNALGQHDWVPAVWFGLCAYPGRTWGCHVMLECGAIYRNVPLHQMAMERDADPWTPEHAQKWDCYGRQFSLLEYPFLASLDCRVKLPNSERDGQYLFTAVPIGDGFSAAPEQAKEFYFCRLDNGRITAQPTDRILLHDRSFVTRLEWPRFLRRQTEIWSAE